MVGIVFHPDGASMGFHYGPANSESQADPLTGDFLSLFDLVEFLENLFLVGVRHAGSGVRDGHQRKSGGVPILCYLFPP